MKRPRNLWPGRAMRLMLAGSLAIIGVVPAVVDAQPVADPNESVPEVSITEYALPTPGSLPGGIVVGPDNGVWFYESGSNQIGRISLDGAITEYPIPASGASLARQGFLAVGPDGALWFTENGARRLGRITVDGNITDYAIPDAAAAPAPPSAGLALGAINTGPDGALWVTEGSAGRLGRRATDGTWREITLAHADSFPLGLIVGLDQALWYTQIFPPNRIGRATADGQLADYDLPTPDAGLLRLTVGPDGAVWFLEGKLHALGHITTDGQITEFAALDGMAAGPGITPGPDGALWFTSFDGNRIERMTVDGQVTGYAVPTENSNPYHIVTGPDGALWFTEMDGNAIGRLEVTEQE